eukprot:2000390-Amphidinium_carterae.1
MTEPWWWRSLLLFLVHCVSPACVASLHGQRQSPWRALLTTSLGHFVLGGVTRLGILESYSRVKSIESMSKPTSRSPKNSGCSCTIPLPPQTC